MPRSGDAVLTVAEATGSGCLRGLPGFRFITVPSSAIKGLDVRVLTLLGLFFDAAVSFSAPICDLLDFGLLELDAEAFCLLFFIECGTDVVVDAVVVVVVFVVVAAAVAVAAAPVV